MICLICALAEIEMALYVLYWGEILSQITFATQQNVESELTLANSLNVALPIGVICVGLLFWLRKTDNIGGFALTGLVLLHLVGYDLNTRAVRKVYGQDAQLASLTWWMPAENHAEADEEDDKAI